MDPKQIGEKLKNSCLTPSSYIPSQDIKTYKHLIVLANNQPIVGVGSSDDQSSQIEAAKLIESDAFKAIVQVGFPSENIELSIKQIDGDQIAWKNEEIAICESEVGKEELEGEIGGVLWLVYSDNALAMATAMCVSEDIQKIASPSLTLDDYIQSNEIDENNSISPEMK